MTPAHGAPPLAGPATDWMPSLAGLRTIAAAIVFCTHVAVHANFLRGDVRAVVTRIFYLPGALSLGFFFILSGFIMTWVTRPGDSRALFVQRRLARIYPNHLFTFAVTGALLIVVAGRTPDASWLANLLLVQSWFPSPAVGNSVNAVSWSLSCELVFYLGFPLVFPWLLRLRADRLWRAVAAVLLAMLAAALVGHFLVGGEPHATTLGEGLSFEQVWFVYRFPPVRALDFVLGMLLARIVLTGRWPPIGLVPAVAIAITGNLVFRYLPPLFAKGGLGAACSFPLIAAAAIADWRGQASPFRHRILVWLGQRTFAFYMVHMIAIGLTVAVVGPSRSFALPIGLLLVLATLAISLGLACLLYRWVEEPMARRFRLARRWRPGASLRRG